MSYTPFFLVWEALSVHHTLNHLQELGLDAHKGHKAAVNLHAHSLLYAHKLTTARPALEKF